jgi:Ca2+-binding EF-hand superfamily protein
MYDKGGDGKITRLEMFEIVKQFLNSTLKYKRAQYRNMAKFIGENELNQHYEDIVEEEVSDDAVTKIVDSAFDQADTDADNVIGLEEFVQWAKTSKAVRNQMSKLGFRFGEKK